VLETLRGPDKKSNKLKKNKKIVDGAALDEMIKDLTDKMWKAGKELKFEEAARLRDEIKQLNEMRLLI
jgi:excinuclease ABC subunit B